MFQPLSTDPNPYTWPVSLTTLLDSISMHPYIYGQEVLQLLLYGINFRHRSVSIDYTKHCDVLQSSKVYTRCEDVYIYQLQNELLISRRYMNVDDTSSSKLAKHESRYVTTQLALELAMSRVLYLPLHWWREGRAGCLVEIDAGGFKPWNRGKIVLYICVRPQQAKHIGKAVTAQKCPMSHRVTLLIHNQICKSIQRSKTMCMRGCGVSFVGNLLSRG